MYYNLIKQHFPSAQLVADGKEILIRCLYCNDSDNPNHAHFYISNSPKLEFHCKKCGSSGRITKNKLKKWGIYDFNFLSKVSDEEYSNIKYKIYKRPLNLNIINDKLAKSKLSYINNRLGLNLDINDLQSNKIVANIKDTLVINNIEPTSKDFIINNLQNNYVGFMSSDNTMVNMRDISNTKKYRYNNYQLYKNIESTGRFYLMPTFLDYSKLTKVHIAEGPFDILSIKYNVALIDDYFNNIFISIGGISYQTVLSYILSELGIISPEFNIYLDNDTKPHVIRNILALLENIPTKVILHRNIFENEKDFGVPKNRIIIKSECIK